MLSQATLSPPVSWDPEFTGVCWSAAQSSEDPVELTRLSAHPEHQVRLAVASNPHCPAEALRSLTNGTATQNWVEDTVARDFSGVEC